MFKVENIHTQVHSVVLTIILCTFHTLPQLMKLLQHKSCPFHSLLVCIATCVYLDILHDLLGFQLLKPIMSIFAQIYKSKAS